MMGVLDRFLKPDYMKVVAELDPDKHYAIVVPEGIDPADIAQAPIFDGFSRILFVAADKLTIMEIG